MAPSPSSAAGASGTGLGLVANEHELYVNADEIRKSDRR